MTARPTILCPIDFSDASRVALRYAAVIAGHVGASLIALTVEDPVLADAVTLDTGQQWHPEPTRRELACFVGGALEGTSLRPAITCEVGTGKPAAVILQTTRQRHCDLIVMSTHGLTGIRKLFFGSTTERVLRETSVPVLATPATAEAPIDMEDIRARIGRILVPVDLLTASLHQVQIARRLSESLGVSFLLTHVVEPLRSPLAVKLHPSIARERQTRAEDALAELLATVRRQLRAEALVTYGDAAEEIVKIARDRRAGLIVVGLHGSPMLGPHMGSVTYRVLCLTEALVLALPPRYRPAVSAADGIPQAAQVSAG